MKKKIGLFLGCTPEWGGQFQYNISLLEAVKNLPVNKFEISIVYTEKIWEDYISKLNCEKTFMPKAKISYLFGIILTISFFPVKLWYKFAGYLDPIVKQILKMQCDLWIFSSYSFTGYQMPVRSISVVHDLMHRYERGFPESSSFFTYHWRELVFKKLCKYNDFIFVDSKLGKEQLIESYNVDNDKIHVMPFSVPGYINQGMERVDNQFKLELPPNFIFYPAQFWEHKNHTNLIQAFSKIHNLIPDVSLVFTGSKKNSYEKVINLIEELKIQKYVSILGFVTNEELVEIYTRAMGLIFPSYFGPTNIPPIEAITCGCPAAVADVYGAKEQLGDAVIYFNPNSIDEIGGAILALVNDLELKQKLISKENKVRDKYSQKVFNQRFEEILSNVLP